jgi:hypothetical protein
MDKKQIELIRGLILLWYANMAWAKVLVSKAFNLDSPQDILQKHGIYQIPGTVWSNK